MSLLNRRKFLTGALFATVAAQATALTDFMQGEPDQPQKQDDLEWFLKDRHPDIAPEILSETARRFSGYKTSALRPAMAGVGASAAYVYLENSKERSAGTQVLALFGVDGLTMAAFNYAVAPVPETHEIEAAIADLTRELNEDQRADLARSVYRHLHRQVVGAPVAPGIAVTMLTKDLVEKRLDRHDVNIPNRD